MSALTVELPENLYEVAREVAAAKNLSMDALVTITLTQSLSRLIADPYLEERAARSTGEGVKDFLKQVPADEAPDWDKLPKNSDLNGGS